MLIHSIIHMPKHLPKGHQQLLWRHLLISSFFHHLLQYVSESSFATIPRWKPIWRSPQKELLTVTKHCCQCNWPRYVSKIRSCLWRVTRNKVQDSSFYGADLIGSRLRTEAQSDPTKCLIIQRAMGKLWTMNYTSKYTPSSKLYRTLADPFHQ